MLSWENIGFYPVHLQFTARVLPGYWAKQLDCAYNWTGGVEGERESKQACEQDQMVFIQFGLCKVHSSLMLDLTLMELVLIYTGKATHEERIRPSSFRVHEGGIIFLWPSAVNSLTIKEPDLGSYIRTSVVFLQFLTSNHKYQSQGFHA